MAIGLGLASDVHVCMCRVCGQLAALAVQLACALASLKVASGEVGSSAWRIVYFGTAFSSVYALDGASCGRVRRRPTCRHRWRWTRRAGVCSRGRWTAGAMSCWDVLGGCGRHCINNVHPVPCRCVAVCWSFTLGEILCTQARFRQPSLPSRRLRARAVPSAWLAPVSGCRVLRERTVPDQLRQPGVQLGRAACRQVHQLA